MQSLFLTICAEEVQLVNILNLTYYSNFPPVLSTTGGCMIKYTLLVGSMYFIFKLISLECSCFTVFH